MIGKLELIPVSRFQNKDIIMDDMLQEKVSIYPIFFEFLLTSIVRIRFISSNRRKEVKFISALSKYQMKLKELLGFSEGEEEGEERRRRRRRRRRGEMSNEFNITINFPSSSEKYK
jgi:hypothetical protein